MREVLGETDRICQHIGFGRQGKERVKLPNLDMVGVYANKRYRNSMCTRRKALFRNEMISIGHTKIYLFTYFCFLR